MPAALACVIIGRNEGERLRRCLDSVVGRVAAVVYVDSGSTDGSNALAREKGATVVELDMSTPFTAARARNEGFAAATRLRPDADYVQFVDGDCEVRGGWIEDAHAHLESHPRVAAVCGRRRERHPESSIYNQLCDMEWAVPVGAAKACGGDAMMRVAAFREVGGYRPDLIAGEEPELCVRLRAAGWGIEVLGREMTLHDAAMTRFGQWWKRMLRSGYAYAEGAHLHGSPPERHNVRPLRSALAWAGVLPAAIVASSAAFGPEALLAAAVYPIQMTRLYLRGSGTRRERFLNAVFLVVAKFPEAQGALRFWRLRTLRRSATLIEYK